MWLVSSRLLWRTPPTSLWRPIWISISANFPGPTRRVQPRTPALTTSNKLMPKVFWNFTRFTKLILRCSGILYLNIYEVESNKPRCDRYEQLKQVTRYIWIKETRTIVLTEKAHCLSSVILSSTWLLRRSRGDSVTKLFGSTTSLGNPGLALGVENNGTRVLGDIFQTIIGCGTRKQNLNFWVESIST